MSYVQELANLLISKAETPFNDIAALAAIEGSMMSFRAEMSGEEIDQASELYESYKMGVIGSYL